MKKKSNMSAPRYGGGRSRLTPDLCSHLADILHLPANPLSHEALSLRPLGHSREPQSFSSLAWCLDLYWGVQVHLESEEETLGYQDNAGGRETILVVEDDQLVRKSLVLFIRSLGYSVLDAGSAEEALDCSMRERISLLLTDLHLPARNGLELAGALRARGTTVPVVLLSGYLNEQTQIQAKQVGINAFLRKPTDLPLLERTLLGVFNKTANMQ